MEIGTIRQVDINSEMQDSYLDYAMSVIVARALPDVRDGLKPVHRRILYAMHDMGLTPDKPYRKSARLVGEVLGKYHPHGDAAVYESMVRMAQKFSLRYPLVDGQGNFGSIDGDEAAAMRYTETRLAPIAMEMLTDLEKGTVAFGPNFDGTLDEPLVLPSALPNFLVNGASGIAVGMATNVPPHNLSEVCDALFHMIDHYGQIDDVTVEDLMQFIRGPDFPTGGIVYRYGEETKDGQQVDQLTSAYAVGRGRFTVQARCHLEEMSRNRSRIVVTELPYQVNKARLIERIADLARDGKLEGLADLRDESDRQGMRLCIELTRTVDPKEVLAKLFKLTPMKMTFGANMLALVDGEPRTLSLKRALWHYLLHRQAIVTRRTEHDLEKARRQVHILEGLLIALDHLDEVIDTIRRSRNVDTARTNLIKKFELTEIQTQAILDMMLRRLAALEQQKIREEHKEKLALIAYLEDLLSDPHKILTVIRDELLELKQRYGDGRRTQLVDRPLELGVGDDLISEEEVLLVSSGDRIWRESLAGRRRGTSLGLPGKGLGAIAAGNTRDSLALFTAEGQGVLLPLHQVPAGQDAAVTLGELTNTNTSLSPAAALVIPSERRSQEAPAGFLFLASLQGKVKRVPLTDFCLAAGRGTTTVMGIEPGDRLRAVLLTHGDEDVVLISSAGQAIRFSEEEVRPMGLPAAGVAGIRMPEGSVVAGAGLASPDAQVTIATAQGYAKRTSLDSFPKQKRYGAGVLGVRLQGRSGDVVGAALVHDKDELFFVTDKGKVTATTPGPIASLSRPAHPKQFIKLSAGDQVVRLLAVYHPEPRRTNEVALPESSPITVSPAAEELPEPSPPAKAKGPSTRSASKQSGASNRGGKTRKTSVKIDRPGPAQKPSRSDTTRASKKRTIESDEQFDTETGRVETKVTGKSAGRKATHRAAKTEPSVESTTKKRGPAPGSPSGSKRPETSRGSAQVHDPAAGEGAPSDESQSPPRKARPKKGHHPSPSDRSEAKGQSEGDVDEKAQTKSQRGRVTTGTPARRRIVTSVPTSSGRSKKKP